MPSPTITPLPQAPSRSDTPADFIQRADAFVAALPRLVTEANVLGEAMDADMAATAADRVQTGLDRAATVNAAAAALTSANSAINAPGTSATSTTSTTIGIGSKTIQIQAGKAISVGQTVSIAYTADATKRMIGPVTAYSGTSLTVNVENAYGTGAFTEWTIALSAPASITSASATDVWLATDNSKAVTPLAMRNATSFRSLTDGTPIVWDVAVHGVNVNVTLGAASTRAMGVPSGLKSGVTYTLLITQPAAGGKLLTFPVHFDFGQAGAPVLSTGANKVDKVRFQVIDESIPTLDATFKKAN